ncbi:MAG: DUF5668 domain-containing protein [Acidimicrobiia bacterium]|nr:DUF5668 domain-containing protein [Acidimicrobiia bacterium]
MDRHGSVFVGTILIGLGTVFMLRALDVWPDDVSTWPGVLIVVGLAILIDQLMRGGYVSWFAPVVLIGLGVYFLLRDIDVVDSDFLIPGLLIVAGILVIGASFRRRSAAAGVVDVPLERAGRARVRLDHGGGELRIGSLPTGSHTLASGQGGGVEQRIKRSGDRVDVSLRQRPGSWARSLGKGFSVDLNRSVQYDLEFNTGASDSKIDLSDLLVASFQLKTGASSTKVWAPQHGHTRATVDAGAASVAFIVPEGVAARIATDTGLADVKIDTRRFPRQGDVYESLDYASVIDRLELRIKGGVASFTVN